MRKANSDFKTAFISRAGSFVENMDYFAYAELDHMACWVMADGLDSDKEIKSAEMAVKSIIEGFMEKPAMSRFKIKKYLMNAHRLLTDESTRVRRKASIVLVVTDYTRIIWAVAGNTRLYYFRNGRLNFKSNDQSLSQVMADAEEIPADKLEQHEERHNLLEYLGKPGSIKPFVSNKYKLNDGDVLLLCTPGLWEGVNSAEMLDAVDGAKEPSELVDTVEEVLLSKQKKTLHNYTIATVFANKIFKEDTKKRMKYVKSIAMVMLIVLIIGAALFIYKVRADAKKAELTASMHQHENNGDQSIRDEDYQKALQEYTEAQTASIQLKDKASEKELGKKERLAQLIVDGDSSFKSGDYDKAQKSYGKAKEEAVTQPDFDMSDLSEKIYKTQSFISVLDLIKRGDLKFGGEDYAGAKDVYQQARIMAIEVSFKDAQKELKSKIDEAEAKMTASEKQKKQSEIELLGKKGDENYAAQKFEQAITFYTLAQEMYQESGMTDKALPLEKKIIQAQEKLNPAPPDNPTSTDTTMNGNADNNKENNTNGASAVDSATDTEMSTSAQ